MAENENINNVKNLKNNNLEKKVNVKNDEKKKEPQKIEVVNGNGDLTISPVYEHLEVEKPRPKENRTIVIPEVKETVSREEDKASE